MDEITQKVVDGTAWREFCDLLADAGEVILAEGNPDRIVIGLMKSSYKIPSTM